MSANVAKTKTAAKIPGHNAGEEAKRFMTAWTRAKNAKNPTKPMAVSHMRELRWPLGGVVMP